MDDHLLTSPPASGLPPAALPTGEPDDAVLQPVFTGSAQEYFRIWIVNLMLTVATLGIYSAWAKVRRLQYFDRNTQLGGAVFDFRGNPIAILRGRLAAAVMLGAYHYAFGFSTAVALTIVGTLALMLPYLLRGAIRFRLQNTRYRGVAFSFTGSVPGAYSVFVPFIVLFVGPAVLVALDPTGKTVALVGLLYLCFPYLYGRLKAYQHGHATYGAAPSSYDVSPWRFYRYYFVAFGLGLLGSIVVGIGAAVLIPLFKSFLDGHPAFAGLALIGGAAAGYLGFLLLIPYMAVRTANLVWSHTTFPGIEIRSAMSARAFARLQVVNVVLTLLTLGLFRPFAVVRTHRFRLAAMTVVASASFEGALAKAADERTGEGASGDGAADFFGFDLSL